MNKMRVKGWADFQHYKDRSPPWIKLHKSLLDNYEYQCLPIASRALAPMIWLLASESNTGEFDGDVKKLAFRLRTTEKEIAEGLKPLIQAGFVECASGVLADCKRDAIPETETETEKELEKEKKRRFDAQAHLVSLGVDSGVVDDWLAIRKTKRLPATKTAIDAIEQEIAKAGLPVEKALRECCNRGWGGFKASWLTDNSQPKMTQHQLNQQGIARSLGLIPKENSLSFFEGEARELAD